MKKAFFARYTGQNASSHQPGSRTNAYQLFRNVWVEVEEVDFEHFENKAKRNHTWEVKIGELPVKTVTYHARFLGLDNKSTIEVKCYDYDDYGNAKTETERVYNFPKDEWVEVTKFDSPFFKKKATNTFWEYDKRITEEEVPKTPETAKEKKEREKAEKEVAELAEKEAKERAEAEAKLLKEQEAEAKAKSDEAAKLIAEAEAKAKVDAEAKALADIEAAKIIADAEAKALADKEAAEAAIPKEETK